MSQQRKPIDSAIESDDEEIGFHRDWAKVDGNVKNEGFRLGLESSQEELLQFGFNAGFKEAFKMALAAGQVEGGICARLSVTPKTLTHPISLSLEQSHIPDVKQTVDASGKDDSLQHLLASNRELIAQIPNFLNKDLSKKLASFGPASENFVDSRGFLAKYEQSVTSASLSPSTDSKTCGSGEIQSVEQKEFVPCQEVCNHKSHFWNQLENFKLQTQTSDWEAV